MLRRPVFAACLALSLMTSCSRDASVDADASAVEVPGSSGAVDLADLAALDRRAVVALALQEARSDRSASASASAPAPERRAAIVERLRADKGQGLDALIADYRAAGELSAEDDAIWRALIDEVAAQRDAVYGGLFWQTDMRAALADSEATGKPVLSLRMLGDLTSEYSCANSRMFRTLLYADPELAGWLEANFVLHWSSERPVPVIEIDFGDGRVVERTITGNSAHFVLDAHGRTIDVLPGLWSVPSFQAALGESLALHRELAPIQSQRKWARVLAAHHEAKLAAAATRVHAELSRVRGEPQDLEAVRAWLASPPSDGAAVPAIDAVPMAVAKAKIEGPVLAANRRGLGGKAPVLAANRRGLGGKAPVLVRPATPLEPIDEAERLMLGARLTGPVTLHANTLAIIAAERPLEGLVPARELDAANARLLDTLVASIQEDTAQNALELYPRVHAELAARVREGRSLGFADVDEWVYAQLFQTPATDPWLGLVDPAIYTGLEAGGIAQR